MEFKGGWYIERENNINGDVVRIVKRSEDPETEGAVEAAIRFNREQWCAVVAEMSPEGNTPEALELAGNIFDFGFVPSAGPIKRSYDLITLDGKVFEVRADEIVVTTDPGIIEFWNGGKAVEIWPLHSIRNVRLVEQEK